MTDAPTAVSPPPIDGHVPVEHRFLGLDRRTIPLTLFVLAVMILFIVVVPAIDRAVGWDDEIRAGDVIDLGDGLTFVPAVGWELTSGTRVADAPVSGVGGPETRASVGNGGVTVQVDRSGFDGTADELLDRVNQLRTKSDAEPNRSFKVTGPRSTVTTASGITGVSEAYTSANGEGRMLAFTLDAGKTSGTPTGVLVVVDGAGDGYAAQADAIDALIASIAFEEPAS